MVAKGGQKRRSEIIIRICHAASPAAASLGESAAGNFAVPFAWTSLFLPQVGR